jgi:N-acylglucosamine-6-phosphate 2-epimerase
MPSSVSDILAQLEGGLIVSCQKAADDDPFNRPEYLALFAQAASMGGAAGIRAEGVANIQAIKQAVDLPTIGIIKGAYPDDLVLVTPDFSDVDEIVTAGAEIIALDATDRVRPNGLRGAAFMAQVRARCDRPLMADVSTLAEGIAAAEVGADIVAPTLYGYTPQTAMGPTDAPDWQLLADLVKSVSVPVIMEGHIWTPDQARRALDLGAFAVVVGTAITRPTVITRAFVDKMKEPDCA